MARNDWATAERLAHTRKGLSGTVGATALEGHAQTLEVAIKAARSKNLIDEALAEVRAHLTALIESIRASLGDGQAAASVAEVAGIVVDPVNLRTACQALAALLRAQDASAGAMLGAHAVMLRTAFQNDFTTIETGVRNFDFEAALHTLGIVAKRHTILLG